VSRRSRPAAPGAGQSDGLGDELGGTARPLHVQFGEHGAGQLLDGAARPFGFQGAHGLRELVQAEGADWVVEQASLGALHAITVIRRRASPWSADRDQAGRHDGHRERDLRAVFLVAGDKGGLHVSAGTQLEDGQLGTVPHYVMNPFVLRCT
jgi:hypothetical protein